MKYNSYAHISNFSSLLRLAKIRVSEDPPQPSYNVTWEMGPRVGIFYCWVKN